MKGPVDYNVDDNVDDNVGDIMWKLVSWGKLGKGLPWGHSLSVLAVTDTLVSILVLDWYMCTLYNCTMLLSASNIRGVFNKKGLFS